MNVKSFFKQQILLPANALLSGQKQCWLKCERAEPANCFLSRVEQPCYVLIATYYYF